ncbi:MAG: hypothetical protein K0R65_758 [Crocinitomicaceae bacterium]|jgi:hypothetical protein|nr:hypothetical protein [Crocinitomicaceae bacterium]
MKTKLLSPALIYIPVFLLLTACYTTNDVFVPDASVLGRPSHELVISTTLPVIAFPQNVGFNYRLSTPNLAGSQWKMNAFARYERGLRKVMVELGGFYNSPVRVKSDNMKFMLMPSYHFSDEAQLGIGLGLEYVNYIDREVSGMYLPMLSVNLNKITSSTEDHTNSWNLSLFISDRMNKTDGVLHTTYTNTDYYDSTTTVYHSFYDYGSGLICKSLKWSYTHEKKFLENPGVSAVFRFDIGITVVGDFTRHSEEIDGTEYPDYSYNSYEGVNFPFGFSMGLKF